MSTYLEFVVNPWDRGVPDWKPSALTSCSRLSRVNGLEKESVEDLKAAQPSAELVNCELEKVSHLSAVLEEVTDLPVSDFTLDWMWSQVSGNCETTETPPRAPYRAGSTVEYKGTTCLALRSCILSASGRGEWLARAFPLVLPCNE